MSVCHEKRFLWYLRSVTETIRTYKVKKPNEMKSLQKLRSGLSEYNSEKGNFTNKILDCVGRVEHDSAQFCSSIRL